MVNLNKSESADDAVLHSGASPVDIRVLETGQSLYIHSSSGERAKVTLGMGAGGKRIINVDIVIGCSADTLKLILDEVHSKFPRAVGDEVIVREGLIMRGVYTVKKSVVHPSSAPHQVPLHVEFLIDFFAPVKDRDGMIGDLRESYPKKIERYGAFWGRVWLYGEVRRTLWWILKTGVAVAVGDWIRRLIF